MKGMLIKRSFAITRSEGDTRDHVFVISDTSRDSHGTVFTKGGWDITQYRSNPIVTYGHPEINSTDHRDIIGRSEIYWDGDRMMARIVYNEKSTKAMEIKQMVDDGFLSMASIRAIAYEIDEPRLKTEKTIYFTRQELVDWGIVMHGSNKNASVQEIKRHFNLDGIEDWEIVDETDKEEEPVVSITSVSPDEARALINKGISLINKIN